MTHRLRQGVPWAQGHPALRGRGHPWGDRRAPCSLRPQAEAVLVHLFCLLARAAGKVGKGGDEKRVGAEGEEVAMASAIGAAQMHDIGWVRSAHIHTHGTTLMLCEQDK